MMELDEFLGFIDERDRGYKLYADFKRLAALKKREQKEIIASWEKDGHSVNGVCKDGHSVYSNPIISSYTTAAITYNECAKKVKKIFKLNT